MDGKEHDGDRWFAFNELARRQDDRLKGIPIIDRVANGFDTRTRGERFADMVYDPVCRAVSATEGFLPARLDVEESVQTLQSQVEAVGKGSTEPMESMLFSQADSLDAIFNSLIQKAGHEHEPAKFELIMRAALKAQNQCAQTLRVLGEIRNPRSVAFIRQQNNANQQIVSNGAPPAPPRPHERADQTFSTRG